MAARTHRCGCPPVSLGYGCLPLFLGASFHCFSHLLPHVVCRSTSGRSARCLGTRMMHCVCCCWAQSSRRRPCPQLQQPPSPGATPERGPVPDLPPPPEGRLGRPRGGLPLAPLGSRQRTPCPPPGRAPAHRSTRRTPPETARALTELRSGVAQFSLRARAGGGRQWACPRDSRERASFASQQHASLASRYWPTLLVASVLWTSSCFIAMLFRTLGSIARQLRRCWSESTSCSLAIVYLARSQWGCLRTRAPLRMPCGRGRCAGLWSAWPTRTRPSRTRPRMRTPLCGAAA